MSRFSFTGSYEEFGRLACTVAREEFNREGTIKPILVVNNAELDIAVVQKIPLPWFSNSQMKQAFGRNALAPLVAYGGATMLAIISESWSVSAGTPAFEEIERRKKAGEPHPYFGDLRDEGFGGVNEDVLIWTAENGQQSMLIAQIIRTDEGPTLSEWKIRGGEGGAGKIETHWYRSLEKSWATAEV